MSVEITFEQDGGSGLVATETSIWEAAKRLGVGLRADCKGRGECDACVVLIIKGADSLSPAQEVELRILGAERLLAGERIACQTRLITTGAVTVRPVPPAVNAGDEKDGTRSAHALPFKQQVGAFIETQANEITKAVNMIRGKSNALIEKFLNLNQDKTDAGSQAKKK